MGKITKVITKGSEKSLRNTKNKKPFKKDKSSHELKLKLKKNITNNQFHCSLSKNNANIIRKKHQSRPRRSKPSLKDTIDMKKTKLKKGEQTQKQEEGQVITKKPFPKTIEGLSKELAELKGIPSREKKLRRKGLKSRIVKKKRQEEKRLKKAAMKLAKKQQKLIVTRLSHTDSDVLPYEIDCAQMDTNKDNKKEPEAVHSKKICSQAKNVPKMSNVNKNRNLRRNLKRNGKKCGVNENSNFKTSPTKNGKDSGRILEQTKVGPKNNLKSSTKQGPVSNKGKTFLLGKVYVPES